MDGYEKTPTLGLNKPAKGDFDWDAPLNENWDILDRVGGAQLPLLATIDLDYKLSGDAAIGWALAGSTLSGDTYTSLWSAMKAAYDRSTAADETHYGATFSVKTDSVTGWRFVTKDVATSANSLFGDHLGHVLDVDAKTILLRAGYQTYTHLPTGTLSAVGKILDQNLPNIKGEFYVSNVTQDVNGQQAGASKTNGVFKFTQSGGTTGAAWNPAGGTFTFDASTYPCGKNGTSAYHTNNQVRPQSKMVFRYYKVGNTITNVENIDVGNVLKELQALSVNSANISLSNVSSAGKQTAVGWGMPNYAAGIQKTSGFTSDKAGLVLIIANVNDNGTAHVLKINETEIFNNRWGASYLNGIVTHTIPVPAGTKIEYTSPTTVKIMFYPFIGV